MDYEWSTQHQANLLIGGSNPQLDSRVWFDDYYGSGLVITLRGLDAESANITVCRANQV